MCHVGYIHTLITKSDGIHLFQVIYFAFENDCTHFTGCIPDGILNTLRVYATYE